MNSDDAKSKLNRVLQAGTTGLLGMCAATSSMAHAQNSSLFQRPISYASSRPTQGANQELLPNPTEEFGGSLALKGQGFPQGMPYSAPLSGPSSLMGLQSSFTYIPPTPTRTLKLHDIVSIRVEEASTSLALGNATSRKSTSYDAVLRDWIRLVGIDTIKPATQTDGDQRVQTIQNEVYRGDSTLRTNESLTTNIAAEIVDIRPNGLIVLSGTKTIIQNDNTFQFSLTGTCRSQDILPDNTILSRNLINATINKQDQGHVRDGYSRGWLTKFLARIKPF